MKSVGTQDRQKVLEMERLVRVTGGDIEKFLLKLKERIDR